MRAILLMLAAFSMFAAPRHMAVISHRGEHLSHPENTLAAYRAAIDLGADYFEVDVQTTADGRLVLMHDGTVDRTTNGKGPVSKLTFAEIRQLSVRGEQVPTFQEALALAKGRIGVYVDAKSVSAEDLVAAIESHKMSANVVVYGGFAYLKQVQKLQPIVKVMPESVSLEVIERIIAELKPQVIAFSRKDWRDDIIQAARRSGAGIFVDMLGPQDTPSSWQDAIDRGATGIQTDRVAELVAYLRARGLHK
jgi:glycerophosphoryl diester phosphodiesterase